MENKKENTGAAPSPSDQGAPSPRRRLPEWMRRKISPQQGAARSVKRMLDDLGLSTVCSGAQCPNQSECFARSTATFMILGSQCSRTCRFCAVDKNSPEALDPEEPAKVAEAAARLRLSHVVITSVTRDDLADGGAAHFAQTCQAVRRRLPEAVIEVLTPDFQGDRWALAAALEGEPDIFNHNLETIERLYPDVRPQADYAQSLEVLHNARQIADERGLKLFTKSGLMVGLGEEPDELIKAFEDLRRCDCEILTIGQYLAPSDRHHEVVRFYEPVEYNLLREKAKALGFRAVAAGAYVRSSYRAEELFGELTSIRT